MASELNFMTELQKMILRYGGVASLLAGGLWYQTDRLQKQENRTEQITEKLENRLKEVEQGLSDCNVERSALKVQVDYIQKTFISNYSKKR